MRFFTFRFVCEFLHVRAERVGVGAVCPCQAEMIKVSLLENICMFNIMIRSSVFNPRLWGKRSH